VELRHLRYFVAVAEELHFGHAAERLHVAQPAVSDQIRKLEALLGTTLFRRTPRSVSLTDAGNVLLPDARRILRQADLAREAVAKVGAGRRARLRVGTSAYGPPDALMRILRRLRTADHVDVDLIPGAAHDLLDDLRTDSIDAAIVHAPIAHRGLRMIELEQAAVVAIRSSRHDDQQSPLAPGALAGDRIVALARRADPAFHDAVLGALVDAGLTNVALEAARGSVDQLMLDIAGGAATGIVPLVTARRLSHEGVAVHQLQGITLDATIALVTRDEMPRNSVATLVSAVLRLAETPQLAVAGRA
jgi:DNA-binding transcriptional LysR family regulator